MPQHRERTTTSIEQAIESAERLLPGITAPDGESDPRWQAIIEVGEYISTHPTEVWSFISKWGSHENEDLRSAIATCLLKEISADQFDDFFPLVEQRVTSDDRFADTFSKCWKMGQSGLTANAQRFDALQSRRR